MISPRNGVLMSPLRKFAPVMWGSAPSRNARGVMSVLTITARSPPPSASTSPIQVSSGTVTTSARQRGTTSQLTGLKPIDRSASISSDTCIVASSEARPAPERPATTMAVTSGPSSRNCAMTTSSGAYTSAPNRPSCATPRNPMMSPMSRFAALVTGNASAPIACISRGSDDQSTERGDITACGTAAPA